jgi:pilus assembly protein CpaF
VHAVLPPISLTPLLCVRLGRSRPASLPELLAGSAPELPEVLAGLARARVSLLVTGGTGAGKTTVLGGLLGALDPSERVVLMEDPPEIRVPPSHVVRLATRSANVEGGGAVSLRDLVREGLRMRPDRLVVGEVRGPEILDLLVALTTGHPGSMATLHATSAAQVPARAAALAALAGLERGLADALLAAGVQAVIHLARGPDGSRGVREIGVVRRIRGRTAVVPALRVAGGALREGPAARTLARLVGSHG